MFKTWIVGLSVALGALGPLPTPARPLALIPLTDPEAFAPGSIPRPELFEPAYAASRVLRGDWEAPELVVLSYASDWDRSLLPMIRRIQRDAQTLVLLSRKDEIDGYRWFNRWLRRMPNVRLLPTELDTPWIRDYGPLQASELDGDVVWLDPHYTDDRPSDDVVPRALAQLFDMRWEQVPVTLDGGAVISNGRGLCGSTLEAFEDSEIDIRDARLMDALLRQLGCDVLALMPALLFDETKHADMFAQFTAADRVAVAEIDRSSSPEDAVRMDMAAHALSEAAFRIGLDLKVVRVPVTVNDEGVYYTSLNGLRLRDAFLVPTYAAVSIDDEARAFAALAQAMPGVELVPIPADTMIELEGAVHCLTIGLSLGRRAAR